MILTLIMIFLLMSMFFLINFILRERIKRDKAVLFRKREETTNVSALKLYERTQGKDDLIGYLLGQEKIWMEKNKASPGGYMIERVIRNSQIIYTQGNLEVPGDIIRKYLSTLTASSYRIGVVKFIKIEDLKEFVVRAEIQIDFVKGNLDQSKPDSETFLEMTVKKNE